MKRISSLLFLTIVAMNAVAGATNLPFIEDDFGKARTDALQRKLPILIEIWAPW